MQDDHSSPPKFLFYSLGWILSVAICLAAGEIILKLSGCQFDYYWTGFAHLKKEPRTNQYHPLLGWVPVPGFYHMTGYSREMPEFSFTICSDGNCRLAVEFPRGFGYTTFRHPTKNFSFDG